MSDAYCEGPLYVAITKQRWEEVYCVIDGRHFRAFQRIRDDFPANKSNSSDKVVLEFDIVLGACECQRLKLSLAELTNMTKNSNLSEIPYFFSVAVSGTVHTLAASRERDRARWLIFIKNLSKPKTRPSGSWVTTGFLDRNKAREGENRFAPLPRNTGNGDGAAATGGGGGKISSNAMPSQRHGVKMEKPKGFERSQSASPALTRRRRNDSTRVQLADSDEIAERKHKAAAGLHEEGIKGPISPSHRTDTDEQSNNAAFPDTEIREASRSRSSSRSGPPVFSVGVVPSVAAAAAGSASGRSADGGSTREDHGNHCHHDHHDDDDDDDDHDKRWLCCNTRNNVIFGIKLDTLVRLWKVCSAFPFVIVVSALNLSNRYTFLRSVTGIRVMNILIYVAPVVYVRYLLSQTENVTYQRLAIGAYILLYLFPVFYVVFSKVKVSSSTSNIEDGTFCFRPARTVRWTMANLFALSGFGFEWLQHILYVLPVGVVSSEKATKLSDFPPYLSFEIYFWACIVATIIAGLIIILNAVLRGKLHYRFQNSYIVWFFVYNVGSPMFVSFVTIFFMSLWCDYGEDPPVLIQQPSIVCYSERHIVIVRAGLVCLAMYIIQNTLLPSGTFKETMRDNSLDILFVPVYLMAHFLLKAVFCGIYVFFYTDNFVRVISLTFINIVLLALNNFMKPCSVGWINVMRDAIFVHATLSGIQSINYLLWPVNGSTKSMVISTLASNVLFSTIGMYVYYKYFSRSTEYTIATAFLDLEWQVSRGGSVHPRVLEPLISLTLSSEPEDWEIAKKYIGQLVWLLSYPNMRVQFQSAWGLANLALCDEDARVRIHDAGGTKALFEWYTDMAPVVQLEVLAAMANLTLSLDVAEEMVVRNKCIPFFIDLIVSNKLKHAQFSAIALSNLARKETFRELLRRSGAIPALVGCIMSHDYQKRRHGARALANMALSPSIEIEQVFESVGLLDRILKMALRCEIETQREVVALMRNLACHARLRPLLLDRGILNAIKASQTSVFEEVLTWCQEMNVLFEREKADGKVDLKALMKREGAHAAGETDTEMLSQMEPLEGKVEWSTWGSKLESIFSPVFSTVPSLVNSQVVTTINCSTQIHLPVGISKGQLARWRDSLSYMVIEPPSHGKLDEHSITSDYVLYTPHEGYSGTDFFTYRMVLGTITTSPATVALTVGTAQEVEDWINNNDGMYSNANRRSGFLAAAAAAAAATAAEAVGGLTDRKRSTSGPAGSRRNSILQPFTRQSATGGGDGGDAGSDGGNSSRRRGQSRPEQEESTADYDVEMAGRSGQQPFLSVSPPERLSQAQQQRQSESESPPSQPRRSKTTFKKSRSSRAGGDVTAAVAGGAVKGPGSPLRSSPSGRGLSAAPPSASGASLGAGAFGPGLDPEEGLLGGAGSARFGSNVGEIDGGEFLATSNASGKLKAQQFSAHPFTDTLMKKMSVRHSAEGADVGGAAGVGAAGVGDGTAAAGRGAGGADAGCGSPQRPLVRDSSRSRSRRQLPTEEGRL